MCVLYVNRRGEEAETQNLAKSPQSSSTTNYHKTVRPSQSRKMYSTNLVALLQAQAHSRPRRWRGWQLRHVRRGGGRLFRRGSTWCSRRSLPDIGDGIHHLVKLGRKRQPSHTAVERHDAASRHGESTGIQQPANAQHADDDQPTTGHQRRRHDVTHHAPRYTGMILYVKFRPS